LTFGKFVLKCGYRVFISSEYSKEMDNIMAKKDSLSEYSIEELYTREETAERLNRGIGTVDRALSLGMFTKAYLDHSKKVYLLKSEVEHMAGYDEAPLTSKKAQARMAAFRRQQDIDEIHV
jgi:hypothetical protein